MTLIDAADAARPPATMPAAAQVILGYIGEKPGTPHVWTTDEVDAVRWTGRTWLPIDVPVQGVLSAAIGQACAEHAIAVLPTYQHPKRFPVFLDVEYSSWEASRTGVMACLNAFKSTMRAAGYSRPYGYLPAVAGFDWIANWTRQRPASLPAGVIGWQYESATQAGDGWDHSVLDPAILTPPAPDPAPADPPATKELPDMLIARPTTPGTYLLVSGAGVTVLADHSSVSALVKAGVPEATLSDRDFAHLEALVK